jgi:hypothetical protein
MVGQRCWGHWGSGDEHLTTPGIQGEVQDKARGARVQPQVVLSKAMPLMALGRRIRAMMVDGYRAHLGLHVEEVGMQVCGFPRFDQERREGERRK